ncbi:MAG: GerW family sporulation protein [Lachnospiraceae bacterium]|nr:GerW family sporulation protein [Lachnospiraceae bacterium]
MAEQITKNEKGSAKNENTITNVMDAMLGNMEHLVGSKTVIGEPTKVGDATIVPLVDVSFGLAAGASQRDCKKNGGMGGMNAKLSPSAILLIQNGHARMISVKESNNVSRIVDLVPELIEKLKARKSVDVDPQEAKESAFPEGGADPSAYDKK